MQDFGSATVIAELDPFESNDFFESRQLLGVIDFDQSDRPILDGDVGC